MWNVCIFTLLCVICFALIWVQNAKYFSNFLEFLNLCNLKYVWNLKYKYNLWHKYKLATRILNACILKWAKRRPVNFNRNVQWDDHKKKKIVRRCKISKFAHLTALIWEILYSLLFFPLFCGQMFFALNQKYHIFQMSLSINKSKRTKVVKKTVQ